MNHQTEQINLEPRRAGRGIRLWLLLPKIIFISLYVGGLATVAFIWISSDVGGLPADDARRTWALDLIGLLMVWFVVPSLVVAIILGIVLFARMPRAYLRSRWMQVKLISLVILIPTAHLYCRSRIHILRDRTLPAQAHVTASRHLSAGLLATLAGSVWVVALGRLKPRFGQPSRAI